MTRSVRLPLALLLLLLAGIGGCGTFREPEPDVPPLQETRLSLWGWIDNGSLEDKLIREAVGAFNDTNPYGVAIDYQTFNDEFKLKIAAEAAANSLPDLFFSWEERFLEPFVASGKVMPLDGVVDRDRFIPGILDHVTFDGKLYAMPLVRTAEVVYYNRSLFERLGIAVPRSRDGMLAAVRKLRNAGVTPIALGNKDVWPGGLVLGTLAYRHGDGEIFRRAAEGTESFTSAPFVRAAADFKRLVDAGAFPPRSNSVDMDAARRLFMEGEAGMWVMGSWELDDLNTERLADGRPNPLHGRVGFFNWPAAEGAAEARPDSGAWIVSPDFNIAVSSTVKSREAAAAFLRLMSSPAYQLRMAEISHLPATKLEPADAAAEDPLVAELLGQLARASDTITFPDRILGQTTIGGAMNNAAQELLAGGEPEETMRRLEARAAAYRTQEAYPLP